MADELWTTDDVARLLAFTPATVREMVIPPGSQAEREALAS